MITLQEFKQGKIAINTRTQEEYDNLMRFFDSEGIEWNTGEKASECQLFSEYEEKTCIACFTCFTGKHLMFSNKKFFKELDYKIILPTQLKEYNEFMGKEVCKNCKIIDKHIVCKKCTIKNPKPKYLTLGQAIDYMLESEDNVVECCIIPRKFDYFRINRRIFPCLMASSYSNSNYWVKMLFDDFVFSKLTKFTISDKKYKKSIKNLIENKEPFEYKNKWYRFNKDGAIIDKKGSAVGIDMIKELLNNKGK